MIDNVEALAVSADAGKTQANEWRCTHVARSYNDGRM